MSHHLKVHELLSREELDSLEEFAREPGRTIDELDAWLGERGHKVSRGAIWKWRTRFDQQVMAERMSRSSELARAMREAVKAGDSVAVAEASLDQMLQVLFEQLTRLQGDGDLDSGDVMKWSIALRTAVGTKQGLEKVKADMQAQQKRAIDEASKVAQTGGSGEAVVQKVREILGIG